jgi:hypothetical protein
MVGSSATLDRTFATTTTLGSSNNPALLWSQVTLTAYVSSPSGTPTGTVTFMDGAAVVGSSLLANGAGSFTIQSLGPGAHTIHADYIPNPSDQRFTASASAAITQQILPAQGAVPTDNSGGLSPAPAAGRFDVSAGGAATYTYSLWVPLGRRGIQPTLAVTYDSRRNNGMLGIGWSLEGLPSITRCKRDIARDGANAAIQFNSSDAFCLDGQRLVAFSRIGKPGEYGVQGTEYRTEEDRFLRIINGPTDDKGPLSFDVRAKDGRIYFYGSTADSKLEGQRFRSTPADLSGKQIRKDLTQTVRLAWALSEVRDRFGNNMTLEYSVTGDPANLQGYEQLPQAIRYTGTLDGSLKAQRLITFEYEPRPDTPTTFVSGLRLQMHRRLSAIRMAAPNPVTSAAVKSYFLKYEQSPATGRSLLSQISECDLSQVCLAPTDFTYSVTGATGFTDIDTGIHDDTATGESTVSKGPNLGQLFVGDVNGDGCDDLIYTIYDDLGNFIHTDYRLSSCYDRIASGDTPFPEPSQEGLYQLSPSVISPALTPDVFRLPLLVDPKPILNDHSNQLLTLDLDLDGRVDLFDYQVDNIGPGSIGDYWTQKFSTSAFLASAVPPTQWTPTLGLFGGNTRAAYDTKTQKGWFDYITGAPLLSSAYIGDINGDGYPDLLLFRAAPGGVTGWYAQLNSGRAVFPPPIGPTCGPPGSACLNLGPPTLLVPGVDNTLTNQDGHVYIVDIDNDGTKDLLLRDPAGLNWYAAYNWNARAPRNIALASGESYAAEWGNPTQRWPGLRDWFVDVNGDGLPDAISIPRWNSMDRNQHWKRI